MNTYVLLGRTGDLCAVLPFLKKEDGCRLVVSNQHSSLLEGVSYVDCVPFDGGVHMLKEAYEWTKSKFSAVKSLQVIGDAGVVLEATYKPSNAQRAMASSFVKEMWRVAGKLDKWDECWPLVFDRRSPEREAKLLADNGFARKGKFKKLILVADEGHSSPFNRKPLLWELIQGRFGKQYQVMRLPKAERFYDLLALYERAVMLVSIDSAPLHLARACPNLPVIALTRDEPLLWNGTPWMPQHVFYCRYSDFTDRAVEMLDTMEERLLRWLHGDSVAVWNACDGGVAQVEGFGTLPLTVGITGRDSSQSVQDTKRYPFLRESIRMALQRCPNGRVCLTRPGVVCGTTIPDGPCYAYRMEKTFVPVVDLFCAPSAQWRSIFHDIPDLILGRDHNWGNALWAMFKKLGAQDVTGVCHKEKEQEVKQEPDAPRLQHNQKLTTTFLIKSKVYSRYPKVSEQVQCLPLDLKALRPHGYNPSIVDYNGMTLLAYRFHEGTLSTKLGLAQITEEGKVISHRVMNIAGTSVEDPRFFPCGDQLCVSWVDSNWPSKDPKSVVRYGTLRDGTAMGFQRPEIPKNDGSTTAKNYVLFEHEETLYCIHEPAVYSVDIGEATACERSVKSWPYGEIRGGTIPVEYDGHLLRFFHSSLDNERIGPHPRRYFVGAYLMEKEPPFGIVKVSTKPIIYGSEVDDIHSKDRKGIIQYKTNVVFPAGVLVRDGHWVVSVGVNDSACTLCKITPKELNL